jgi:thymidylate synthase
MRNVKIEAFDIPDAWYKALKEIYYHGDRFNVSYGSEPSWTKKLSVCIDICRPETRPLVSDKAVNNYKYVQEYSARYLWENMRMENEHYTYGSRMREPVDQITEVIHRIAGNPRDRQCTIVIRRPEDIFKKAPLIDGKQVLEDGIPVQWDPPCLTCIDLDIEAVGIDIFEIHPHIYFRSWDCGAGFPSNVAGLQLWNEQLVEEINEVSDCYFKTGRIIGLCKNLHIYERQFSWVKSLFDKVKE